MWLGGHASEVDKRTNEVAGINLLKIENLAGMVRTEHEREREHELRPSLQAASFEESDMNRYGASYADSYADSSKKDHGWRAAYLPFHVRQDNTCISA